MFAVVGLTLDDVWSGALPQVRLADVLKTRRTREAAQSIVIYTTDPGDTQGPITRARYKGKGTFLTILYLNEAAVSACHEFKIPLRILDHVEEGGLPEKKIIAFEYPSLAPAIN